MAQSSTSTPRSGSAVDAFNTGDIQKLLPEDLASQVLSGPATKTAKPDTSHDTASDNERSTGRQAPAHNADPSTDDDKRLGDMFNLGALNRMIEVGMTQGIESLKTDLRAGNIRKNLNGTFDMRTKASRRIFGIREFRDKVQGSTAPNRIGKNDPKVKELGIPENLDGSVDRRTKLGRAYEAMHRNDLD